MKFAALSAFATTCLAFQGPSGSFLNFGRKPAHLFKLNPSETNSFKRDTSTFLSHDDHQDLRLPLLDSCIFHTIQNRHESLKLIDTLLQRLEDEKNLSFIPRIIDLIALNDSSAFDHSPVKSAVNIISVLSMAGNEEWESGRLEFFKQVFDWAIAFTQSNHPTQLGSVGNQLLSAADQFTESEDRKKLLDIANHFYNQNISSFSKLDAQQSKTVRKSLEKSKVHKDKESFLAEKQTSTTAYTEEQRKSDWDVLTGTRPASPRGYAIALERCLPSLNNAERRRILASIPERLANFEYRNYRALTITLRRIFQSWSSISPRKEIDAITDQILSAFDHAKLIGGQYLFYDKSTSQKILCLSMALSSIKLHCQRDNKDEHNLIPDAYLKKINRLLTDSISDLKKNYSLKVKSKILEIMCQVISIKNIQSFSELPIDELKEAINEAITEGTPLTVTALSCLLTAEESKSFFESSPAKKETNKFLSNITSSKFRILVNYFLANDISTFEEGNSQDLTEPHLTSRNTSLNNFLRLLHLADQKGNGILAVELLRSYLDQSDVEDIKELVSLAWREESVASAIGHTAQVSTIDISPGGDAHTTFASFLKAWCQKLTITSSETLKKQYESIEVIKKPDDQDTSESLEEIEPLKVHGRTIYNGNICHKLPKRNEDPNSFLREEKNTRLFLANIQALKSFIPTPIGIQPISVSENVLNNIASSPDIDIDLDSSKLIDAYAYYANPEYHQHIFEASTLEEFKEASVKNLHDRGYLARKGFLPYVISSMFHNDQGRVYHWDADRRGAAILKFGARFGTGRHHAWSKSIEYTNLGITGNRDLKHFFFFDSNLDPDDKEKLLAEKTSLMGDTLYEWTMTVGRWFLEHHQLSINSSDESHEALVSCLKEGYSTYFSAYTGKPLKDSCKFLTSLGINWHLMARQMEYFMSEDYIDDVKNGTIRAGIYEESTKVICTEKNAMADTWDETKGFCSDGVNPDLGPFSGPNPLVNVIDAITKTTALAPWVALI